MKLKLITYGCGNKFDVSKFKPVTNNHFIKPKGGLWASPVNSSYGWHEWCKDNEFGDLSSMFEFEFDGNILIVDSLNDAKRLPWIDGIFYQFPDFEAIANQGYDAIWLTINGEQETRFSRPSFYGWDCECVLILNDEFISPSSLPSGVTQGPDPRQPTEPEAVRFQGREEGENSSQRSKK